MYFQTVNKHYIWNVKKPDRVQNVPVKKDKQDLEMQG